MVPRILSTNKFKNRDDYALKGRIFVNTAFCWFEEWQTQYCCCLIYIYIYVYFNIIEYPRNNTSSVVDLCIQRTIFARTLIQMETHYSLAPYVPHPLCQVWICCWCDSNGTCFTTDCKIFETNKILPKRRIFISFMNLLCSSPIYAYICKWWPFVAFREGVNNSVYSHDKYPCYWRQGWR